MDKQTIIGFVLIALVLMVWMWTNAPTPDPQKIHPNDSTTVSVDSLRTPVKPIGHSSVPLQQADTLGKYFSHLTGGRSRIITVETDLYKAEITSKGALVRKWELKKYSTWNGYPVQMVSPSQNGDYSILFNTSDGKLINTRSLDFKPSYTFRPQATLTGNDSLVIDFSLAITESARIVKRYIFKNDKYWFDSRIEFLNMEGIVANYEYIVTWEKAVPYAEHNSVNESQYAQAYAFSGGELTDLDASDPGVLVEESFNGEVDWVGARNKYFATVLLPQKSSSSGFELEGVGMSAPDQGLVEQYSLYLKVPFRGGSKESTNITVFLGPLDIDVISPLNRNIEKMLSLGAAWIIRPISEYVLLPLFGLLKSFIPNFGIVIIIFSLIIKIALNPLSRTSMKSMKKMQSLQPMMEEIRAKYKDDQQKMNQQIMSLYKDYGVNPASGCLPLLLQMPILYALYSIFSASIELRQAEFVWWIKDLSVPDVLFKLPFKLPLFGMDEFSGLALAMGLTMFIQQKMTVTDPRQKMMVWMMPLMLTLLFNSFPSGLNLYYFVFNLLSIGQQYFLNKSHDKEPLKKVDPKKRKQGFLERLAKDLPKVK